MISSHAITTTIVITTALTITPAFTLSKQSTAISETHRIVVVFWHCRTPTYMSSVSVTISKMLAI